MDLLTNTPPSQNSTHTTSSSPEPIDFVVVFILKLALVLIAWLLLKVCYDRPFFPYMPDQYLYYNDLIHIADDPSILIQSDAHYRSNNTLYSRFVGFLYTLLFWIPNPFLLSIVVNMVFSILSALLTLKIYDHFAVENHISRRVIFYAVCFSPMMNLYSLFVLRDIMVTFFFTALMYSFLKRNWSIIFIIMLLMMALRPFLCMLFCALLLLYSLIVFSLRYRYWWAPFVTLSIIFVSLLYFFPPQKLNVIINFLLIRFDASDSFRMLALGAFTHGSNVSQDTSILSRLLSVDSVVIPFWAYSMVLIRYRYLTIQFRVFSFLIFAAHIASSITYLSIFDSFTARKLLMFMPFFYSLLFVAYDCKSKHCSIKLMPEKLPYNALHV